MRRKTAVGIGREVVEEGGKKRWWCLGE